jgi:hypothetical protein
VEFLVLGIRLDPHCIRGNYELIRWTRSPILFSHCRGADFVVLSFANDTVKYRGIDCEVSLNAIIRELLERERDALPAYWYE